MNSHNIFTQRFRLSLAIAVLALSAQLAQAQSIRIESSNAPGKFLSVGAGGELVLSSSDPVELEEVPALNQQFGSSFRSVKQPGHYLRHQNGKLYLQPSDGTIGFKNDASFSVMTSGRQIRLALLNFIDHFVRNSNNIMRLDRNDGSPLFQQETTFQRVSRNLGRPQVRYANPLGSDSVQIAWNQVVGATKYVVEVRERNSGKLVVSSVITTDNAIVQVGQAGDFDVTVEAQNANGYGPASQARQVTIAAAIPMFVKPGTPVLTGPQQQLNNPTLPASIRWNAVANAASYEVYVYIDGASQPMQTANGTTHLQSLSANGSYAVYVRGVAADGTQGDWSQPVTFTVSRNAQPPLPPVGNELRILNYQTNNGQATVTWTAVNNAVQYEVWCYNQTTGQPLFHLNNSKKTANTFLTFWLTINQENDVYEVHVRPIFADGSTGPFTKYPN